MVIGASKREILFEKLPLDLPFLCVCVCSQMGGVCGEKMGAVSQPNETNLLSAHTYTHIVPSGQWKCHIIGFPFQDNRHAHWIRSDHRRQFSPCLPLSAFPTLFCFLRLSLFCIPLFLPLFSSSSLFFSSLFLCLLLLSVYPSVYYCLPLYAFPLLFLVFCLSHCTFYL